MGPPTVTTYVKILLSFLILEAVFCDMQEFLVHLPSDIGNSVNNAWNNIVKAIKRPVRIRRLGKTGKTKSSRALTMSTEKLKISTHPTTPKLSYDHVIPLTTARSLKLVLPVLATPHWRSMLDWRKQQQDTFLTDNKRFTEYYRSYEHTSGINKISSDDEVRHFGNLLFV